MDVILSRIEQCWVDSDEAKKMKLRQRQWLFFELAPFVNGIIQVGSSRAHIKGALRNASLKTEDGAPDSFNPISYLSVQTLLYIIDKGYERHKEYVDKTVSEREKYFSGLPDDRKLNAKDEAEYTSELEKMWSNLCEWTRRECAPDSGL